MFDLNTAISTWRHALKNDRAFFDEDLDELERHLRDEVEYFKAVGLNEERAFRRAIREMGDLGSIKNEYQKVYWQKAKHRRHVMDEMYWQLTMIKNYLKIAFRNARRHMGFASINVAGLGIGMACCILILMWVRDELSYDRFHENSANLYRVVQDIQFSDHSTTWGISQGPLAAGLREEIPEISHATRWTYVRRSFTLDGQSFDELGGLVDASFLDMFSFKLLKGDPETALSDPTNFVITEKLADRFFGDSNPLGEILQVSGSTFTVSGVIADVPENSSLQFSFLGNMEYAGQLGYSVDSWRNSTFGTYVMLEEGAKVAEVNAKISDYLYDKPTLEEHADLRLQPVADLHLRSNIEFDLSGQGDITYVYTFSVVALFILLVACINFMNLSTARSAIRTREVGMRKVVGAHRRNLATQFLGESILLSIFSLGIGVALVLLALPWFGNLAGKELTLDIFTDLDVLVGLVCIVLVVGVVAGSYPALYLSAVKPVGVLRAGGDTGTKGSKFRGALVVLQFSLSIILIVGTLTVYGQIQFMQNAKLGYEKEQIVTLERREGFYNNYEIVRDELLNNTNIRNVTATSSLPTYGFAFSNSMWKWEGQKAGEEILIRANFVGYDYPETLGIEIVAGRSFSRDMASDSSGILINETAARVMGFDDPVGHRVQNGTHVVTIVGIVKDYNYRSLHAEIEPLILIFSPPNSGLMAIAISSENIPETIADIEETWTEFVVSSPFDYTFLDVRLDRLYASEQRTSKLLQYFAILAIFISSLGLLGLAAHTAERRTKEIGMRKVMGASTSGIVVLLSRTFSKWALMGNIIAWPLAFILAYRWLDGFAYRMTIQWTSFVIAGALALVIALVTVSYQAKGVFA